MIHRPSKTTAIDAAKIKDFLLIIIFSILTAIGAWIEIPLFFTPVPLTLQTLVVSLAGAFLGAKKGAMSQLAYLFYGICGLPVFAGGAAGFAYLLGPTGGYLIGFPISAFLTGLLVSRYHNYFYNLTMFLIGSLPVLILGTVQLQWITGRDFAVAMSLGFTPFIAGDFIKCVIGAGFFTLRERS